MVHLINEINNIIFEDLTINHNVKTNAKEISTFIKNEFLKKYTNGDFNTEGYKIISFNSSYNLNYMHNDDNCNENIKLIVNIFCFNNNQSIKNAEIKYGFKSNGMTLYRKLGKDNVLCNVSFDIPAIGNQIIEKELNNVVQHELNHIFQQIYANDNYKFDNRYFSSINKLNSTDEQQKEIAQLIYYLQPEEISSFVNGMYGEVTQIFKSENNTEDINDLIKRSETWNIMVNCQNYLNNLINNQNISELNILLQNYDITYDKFIRIYSKRLNILKNKVGKCIIKIKMDLFNLKECSIVMTFGVLNETLKRNVPLFYDFYKII